MTLIGRLRSGLRRTAERLGTRVDEILGRDDESGRKALANPETLEALEELLIEADVGVAATTRIVETLRSRLTAGSVNLRDELKQKSTVEPVCVTSSRDFHNPKSLQSRFVAL